MLSLYLFRAKKETALPPSNLNHSEDFGGIFAIPGNPSLAEREGSLFGPRTQSWKLNLIDFWAASAKSLEGPNFAQISGEFLDGPRKWHERIEKVPNALKCYAFLVARLDLASEN